MSLPSIEHPTRIPKLNAAIERGYGQALLAGKIDPQQAYETIRQDAQAIEPILLAYQKKAELIEADQNLSMQGKNANIQIAFEVAFKQLEKIDKTESLIQGVKEHEAQLYNTIHKRLAKDAEGLDPIDQREIRAYLLADREEKKKGHEAWLADQKEAGSVVPDEMRRFNDPVEQLFLDSCRTYDKEKALFYRAVTAAPWPVTLLSRDVLSKGRDLLEKKIAPERVHQLAEAVARQSMYGTLLAETHAAMRDPSKIFTYRETRKLQTDEQRAAA